GAAREAEKTKRNRLAVLGEFMAGLSEKILFSQCWRGANGGIDRPGSSLERRCPTCALVTLPPVHFAVDAGVTFSDAKYATRSAKSSNDIPTSNPSGINERALLVRSRRSALRMVWFRPAESRNTRCSLVSAI